MAARSRAECAALIARWRVRLAEQRSLHLAERFAAQKAKSSLMRKIVLGWQKATGATWRRATEKRIRLGAEKALAQLSSDYEKRLRDISSTLAKTESRLAASENENLRAHDEMKKALMRGVCALNMEAMSVFRESSPVMFDNLLTVGVPAQQNKPPPQQMAAPAPAFNFLPVEPTHNVGDLTHQNPKQNRRTIPTPRSSFGPWGTDAPRVIRHVGKEGSYIASMEAGGRAKG
ncbi:Centrosomal protein poc5 [Irineochytrium annulatum]|nr:Centrosomal protein poc5 [Irineochytrium annulatum]